MATLVTVGMITTTAASAQGQIYSYTLPDGSIAYTDSLDRLPPKRRAFYNRQRAEQATRQTRVQQNQTPAQRRATKRHAQRAKAAKKKQQQRRRQARQAAMQLALQQARQQTSKETQERAYWQEKKAHAKQQLDRAHNAYKVVHKEWQAIAIRAQFSLFPGEPTKRVELEKQLHRLKKEISEAQKYLSVTLPSEARKAGVPPGYLR
ncbi:MAG: hypothetical protein KTR25_00955 [Myxococcales bacterium]|nr:hypothetical protein [Myxococcales bacterium]